MLLIHKLRRSISRRPRHLFDLPDEVLCIILEYCCQDLDFLLWTCPLVTLDNQFCHDCYHCTLCHGYVSHKQPGQIEPTSQRIQSESMSRTKLATAEYFQSGRPMDGVNIVHIRKRRKRNHDSIFDGRSDIYSSTTSNYNTESTPLSLQGTRPCPWNGGRPWCLHLQRRQSNRTPLLWHLAPSLLRSTSNFSRSLLRSFHPHAYLAPLSASLTFIQLPAKFIFGILLRQTKASFFSNHQQQSEANHDHSSRSMQTISSGSAHHVSTCTHVNPTLISSSLTPQYTINPIPASYSTGFNLEHTTSIYRRGSMTMNTHDEYSSASATMNRSLNMAGATYVSNHQNCSEWNSTAEQIENCAITDNEQHRDNFDSSINLSAPFQLLLVNQRFADAAVHSLYRNLVFHGHDLFQMESIFSMLCENDRTLDESFLVSTKANDEDQAQICNNRTHVLGLQDKLKSNSIRIQGGCNGDIFDNLEGKPQRKTIESNVLNVDVKTNVDSSASSSSSFMEKGCRNDKFMQHSNSSKEQCSANDRNGETIASQNGVPHTYSNGPKWRYWRYTRRVVLNFTHPQASPEMLIRAIECIKSRCYNQIQVLDLHANEKMQDSGLETPVELIRLFGSGFSKLQYLRLQGGFVDNHLLYALLRNFSPPQHPQLVDSAQGNPNNRWAQSSLLTVEPCCLSQVFLGPGSVTDSAIEKLIDIAGMTLEVFVVTSCVDFGGGALASLLTECPKLRVLGVHKSLARDKELLEGLGMPKENTDPVFQQYQHPYPHHQSYSEQQQQQQQAIELSDKGESLPQITRKLIIAPLERLELGTTKLTNIGIAEILKATCKTLRFLVLETQHFRDELLRSVISPFCTELEGLYFDDPEQVQRHQQQMQGFGFSAGRRGAHLSRHRILFGRSGRSFYMDPNQHDRSQSRSQSSRNIDNLSTADYQGRSQHKRTAKVSAWLGEITTDEWVEFGDCALWSSAASPAVSYDNGGTGESNEGRSSYHSRHFGQPLYQMFHKPAITTGNISVHGFSHQSRYQSVPNWLLGDSDDLLNRYQISRELVDEVQNALPNLKAFTVIDIDFILERKGLYESQLLMQQDDMWVQSTGFRALQIFYLCLFLTSICFTIFR